MKNKLILLAVAMLPLVFANCSEKGNDEKPEDTTTILTFTDKKFSTVDERSESARFFSTSLDQSIKLADVTAENAPKIDLGLGVMASTMCFFVSPDDADYGIENDAATKTEYMLDLKGEKITAEQFDAIDESADFDGFEFTSNKESFPFSSTVPFFCFFKNAAGKMGVMKITEVTKIGSDPAVTVDIKVQK
jgi:hypothetical protein